MPQTFLDHAAQWFRSSGIQETGGGVARYYLSGEQRNRPVSTEITGYAISTLLYLHHLTGQSEPLDGAVLAGRFLERAAWVAPLGVFPFELDQPFAYFFDCGIIVRGLLALWRVTANPEPLALAADCGRSMAADFAAADGPWHPVLHLPSKQPADRENRWSRSPGCYQLKAALAWHELAESTGEAAFESAYQRALDYALSTHEDFLPGHPQREKVMDRLHAYAYFLEGLLPRIGEAHYAAVFRAGLDRAAALLRQIGPVFERSDVCAQILRLRLWGNALGAVALDEAAAEEEALKVASYQRDDADRRIHGGFAFGRKGRTMEPYINPVSTGFCVQALAMWREHRSGGLRTCPRQLI